MVENVNKYYNDDRKVLMNFYYTNLQNGVLRIERNGGKKYQ